MSQRSLRVVARIKAKPETIDEVRELLSSLVEPTRQESGCIQYELLQTTKDETDFTFVEEWTTETALDSHAKSAHIQAVRAKLQTVVADAPDIRTYFVVR